MRNSPQGPQADEENSERIKRLRDLLERRGWTEQDGTVQATALARELVLLGAPPGTSKTTVAKWLNGDTKVANIHNPTLLILCQLLKIDPRELMWGPSKSPPTDSTGRFKRLGS